MSEPDSTTDHLRARVLAEIAKAPSPTRDVVARRSRTVVLVGAVVTALAFVAMGGVRPGARPLEMLLLSVGVALASAVVLLYVVRPPSGSMLARPRAVVLVASAAAAPVLAVAAVVTALVWPGLASEPVLTRIHVACGAMTVAQGLVPLAALFLTRRGSDPVHPVVSGAALGMAAGALAATMAYARCPHAAVAHCLAAHVAPALLLAALGAALGALVLRVRKD